MSQTRKERIYEVAPLAKYPRFSSGFKVKDAGTDVGVLVLADFAFPVEIPYWFRQGLEYIGPFSSQGIIDMVHGSNVRLSAFESSRNAEQAHQVRVVCMKELAVVVSVEDQTTRDPWISSGHTVHSFDIS